MAFQSPVLQASQEVMTALEHVTRAIAAIDAAYGTQARPETVERLLSRIAEQKRNLSDLARELQAHGNLRPQGY